MLTFYSILFYEIIKIILFNLFNHIIFKFNLFIIYYKILINF